MTIDVTKPMEYRSGEGWVPARYLGTYTSGPMLGVRYVIIITPTPGVERLHTVSANLPSNTEFLRNRPSKIVRYLNIFKDEHLDKKSYWQSGMYDSEREAKSHIRHGLYIATVKIEFED